MTGKLKPEVVCSVGAEHGEGPLWHPTDRRLDWTDLAAGRLHRFDPATGGDEVIEVGSPLGAFAPREQGGFVLAVKPYQPRATTRRLASSSPNFLVTA